MSKRFLVAFDHQQDPLRGNNSNGTLSPQPMSNVFVIGNGRMPKSLIISCIEFLSFSSIVRIISLAKGYDIAIKRYISGMTKLMIGNPYVAAVPLLSLCHQLQSLTLSAAEYGDNGHPGLFLSPAMTLTVLGVNNRGLTSLNISSSMLAGREQAVILQLLSTKSISVALASCSALPRYVI
jgi:hypothetical protein